MIEQEVIERFERLTKAMMELSMQVLEVANDTNSGNTKRILEIRDELATMVQQSAPEPMTFQEFMARRYPHVEEGGGVWKNAACDWNLAMDVGANLPKRYGSPDSMVDRSAILALKEPQE